MGINDWEIEHIHHLAIEQGRIAPTFGQESSQLHRRTLTEQDSIENAVHNVAQGTRQNQGDTDNETCLQSPLHALIQEPANERHRH